MEYSIDDMIHMFVLKNHLIKQSDRMLDILYGKTDEDYCFFIDTLNISIDAEPSFFMVEPQILERAMKIVYKKRFDIKDTDVNAVINEIISNYNKINSMPESERNIQRNAYLAWQEQTRNLSFSTQDDFLNSLAYDAVILKETSQGSLDDVNPAFFFASVNYLATMFPEFYQLDESRIDKTFRKLDELSKAKGLKNWPLRSFAKHTIKQMQKVKTIEE